MFAADRVAGMDGPRLDDPEASNQETNMSAISSAASGVQGLYQFLQNLQTQNAQSSSTVNTSSTSSSSNSSTTGSLTASLDSLNGSTQQTQGGHHHHGGGMFKKIEDAVTSALQSAGSSSDPNKVVQDAIAKVLNGQNSSTSSTSNGSTAANASTSSSQETETPQTTQQFLSTLQAYGITPEEFGSDLMTAMQNAQGGANLSSFPPGLFVDTTA